MPPPPLCHFVFLNSIWIVVVHFGPGPLSCIHGLIMLKAHGRCSEHTGREAPTPLVGSKQNTKGYGEWRVGFFGPNIFTHNSALCCVDYVVSAWRHRYIAEYQLLTVRC